MNRVIDRLGRAFVLLVFLFLCHASQSQSKYPILGFEKIEEVSELPAELTENSGLVSRTGQGTLIGHNDSGGKPVLYEFNKQGQMIRTITVADGKNKDWEDLASDDDYIFIGDFGNNAGSRDNLRVYRIPFPPAGQDDVIVDYKKIKFSYAEQKDFNKRNKHNFDCEAMISLGDSLYLFTKNRGDWQTNMYVLPKTKGEYKVSASETFNCGGLITGADIQDGVLALVGYTKPGKKFQPFVWLFTDFEGADFFSGRATRVDLPYMLQAEAIIFDSPETFVITNEEEEGGDGRIFRIRTDDVLATRPAE